MHEDVRQILRQWDRPRYLAHLFAPDASRDALCALYAFAAEISRVPLAVSDPQIGLIRLQWWRDVLEGIAGGKPQQHPVAAALAQTISTYALPMAPLHSLIDAHERDLFTERPETVPVLEEYLGKTSSALIQLAAMILAPKLAPAVAEAAGLSGVAFGIALIVNDRKRFANLVPEGEDAVSLAHLARRRLAEARAKQVPTGMLPAFLHVTLTELFLEGRGTPPAQWRMQWRLWRAARRETF